MRIQSTSHCGCLLKMTWMTSQTRLSMIKMMSWKEKLKVNGFSRPLFPVLQSLNAFPQPRFPPLFIAKADENGQSMTSAGGASSSNERLYWPGASALTARLRRLITAYQRSNRREQLRQEALNRPDGRRRRRRDFLPSLAMVTDTGAATTYIQDGTGVFVTEGSPYMAKGSGYFAKGGQFVTEPSQVMTASSLMADGGMYYKERRQRYVEIALNLSTIISQFFVRNTLLLYFCVQYPVKLVKRICSNHQNGKCLISFFLFVLWKLFFILIHLW